MPMGSGHISRTSLAAKEGVGAWGGMAFESTAGTPCLTANEIAIGLFYQANYCTALGDAWCMQAFGRSLASRPAIATGSCFPCCCNRC